ncbi:hypothetical protein IQ264_06530 [Phormidium sp. LEGE 05292]|uniref:hypothetical protein n=1 Tax=[Phormidium] sp. LEGE 05292 TaxID=767427 RepID=UPI00187E6396|nr:hypothetical protein [Phormidium sp. LEGE 05292]MBE9225092.1 hypothetical protein [Phormidium sp. LEGE 05292]
MPENNPQLTPDELQEWQMKITIANLHNILCHCRNCNQEWVASSYENCSCGSTDVERILCWQFPDD